MTFKGPNMFNLRAWEGTTLNKSWIVICWMGNQVWKITELMPDAAWRVTLTIERDGVTQTVSALCDSSRRCRDLWVRHMIAEAATP